MNKFIKMKQNYSKSIGKGLVAQDGNGNPITEQTRSIWFSRQQLENLLELTDEKEGGLRIFLAQYDEETVPAEFNSIKEKLIGKITVALAPCKVDEAPHIESFMNGGLLCPPDCIYDTVKYIDEINFENTEK